MDGDIYVLKGGGGRERRGEERLLSEGGLISGEAVK